MSIEADYKRDLPWFDAYFQYSQSHGHIRASEWVARNRPALRSLIEILKIEEAMGWKVWIGADFKAAKSCTIYPSNKPSVVEKLLDPQEIEVLIDKKNGLPPLDFKPQDPRNFTRNLGANTRSRIAQLGFSIINLSMAKAEETGDYYKANAQALLYGDIPIQINEGDRIGHLYSIKNARRLEDKELVSAIREGRVKVGKGLWACGDNWAFVGDDGEFLVMDQDNIHDYRQVRTLNDAPPTAIAMKISNQRFYTPHGLAPISILGDNVPTSKYREIIDGTLKPAKDEHHDFWVAQTIEPLEIPEGLTGVLRPHVVLRLDNGALERGPHIISLLIKGGETNYWPIRVELFTPHIRDEWLSEAWAIFDVYKNRL